MIRTYTEEEFTKVVLDLKDKLLKEGLERAKGRTDAEVQATIQEGLEVSETLDKECTN